MAAGWSPGRRISDCTRPISSSERDNNRGGDRSAAPLAFSTSSGASQKFLGYNGCLRPMKRGRVPYKYQTKLGGKEKRTLRQARKKGTINARVLIWMLSILLADKGKTIAETAELLDCCERTVLNWRKRFLERRSAGPVAGGAIPKSGRQATKGTIDTQGPRHFAHFVSKSGAKHVVGANTVRISG